MSSPSEDLDQVAAAFGRETDPLAQYEQTFDGVDVDPLEAYLERVKRPNNTSDSTLKNYRYAFDQWEEFMETVDRHPACPNDHFVKEFMAYLADERENAHGTIQQKVDNVKRAYEWWQDHHAFPHPTDYNPFQIAKRETDLSEQSDAKKHPPISRQELSQVIRGCKNVRERLFLVWMLKLGLRVGELLNIRLEDIAISNASLEKWYPELGTADVLEDYEDAVYIPSRHTREGNKSHRPRILPLDDELKQVLLQYLPTRPLVETRWLILSLRTYEKIERGDRVNKIWREYFSEFNELEQYRDITSHYGRYYFTNHWRVQEDLPRELVQYMRGDKLGISDSGESIDEYLTAHYEDIEAPYFDRTFKLL